MRELTIMFAKVTSAYQISSLKLIYINALYPLYVYSPGTHAATFIIIASGFTIEIAHNEISTAHAHFGE